MTHASVFSGIGGPEVAASMLGWENIFHCEINPFGKAVLDYWFPNAESYEDITKTDFTPWRGRVDVLTGGFPCQPFSYAGKRRGAEDDRYLWPSMFRCIDEIQPTWVVCENVAGILTMVEQGKVTPVASQASLFDTDNDIQGYELRETFTLQRICDDLEGHGYEVQPILIPACGVGAPHRRDRVFIIGHRIASADTAGGREGASGSGTSAQGCGRNADIQSGERKPEAERDSGLHAVPRHASHADRQGREESQQPGRAEDSEKAGAGLDNRAERLGRDGIASDTHCDRGSEVDEHLQSQQPDGAELERHGGERTASDSGNARCGGADESWDKESWLREHLRRATPRFGVQASGRAGGATEREDRWTNFPTVSPVHRGNDGLPFFVGDLTISPAKWRTEALKAYGNAIVPQVMYEIFRAIELVEQ